MKCPGCDSIFIVKCGKRETKRGSRQQYHCNNCGKRFVHNPFPGKTYRPAVIIEALKLYHSGNTLSDTSKLVNHRYKVNTSKSTVHNWIKEFENICGYSSLRREHKRRYGTSLIKKNPFYHGGLRYDFQYHTGKLMEAKKYHRNLVEFIMSVPKLCPDELFNDEDGKVIQASKLNTCISEDRNLYKTRNNACELAELTLKANRNRRSRHTEVEDTLEAELPLARKAQLYSLHAYLR